MAAALALPAVLTQREAAGCARALVQAASAQAGPAVVLQAGALERFDSSALAVLLEVRRAALGANRTFAVQAMPRRLRDLAGLYGVDVLLPAAPEAR